MRAVTKAIVYAFLPLGLFACAGPGGSVTHSIFYDFRYYPQQVRAGGGPIPVELRGAPAGMNPAEFIAGVRAPAYINRETRPAEPGESGPRLVFGFAPASGGALCRHGGGPEGAVSEPTISGAYCVGGIPYSSAITKARGGDLAQAANALTRVLLPQVNPEHRRRIHDRP